MTSAASPVPPPSAEPVDKTRAAWRGMWIAGGGLVAAIASSAVFVGLVLASLDYDFDNGLLEPFAPAWGPVALLLFAAAIAAPVLGGRRWARWLAAGGFAGGAAWILFVADLEPRWLPAATAAAVCWGVASVSLAVPRSVGAFMAVQRGQAVSYSRLFGALDTERDVLRWLAAARAWDTAGVLTRRDRIRVAQALRHWAGASASVPDDVTAAIDALAPVSDPPGTRADARLLKVWRTLRGRRRRSGPAPE